MEMPYKCRICGKLFACSSQLQCHECKHSGENCRGGRYPEKTNRIEDLDGETIINVHPSAGYMNLLSNSESKSQQDASTTKCQGKSPEISNAITDVSGKMATRKRTLLSYNEENECMICGKKFQYLFILDSHLRAHSAEEIDDILKMFQSSTDDESLSSLASWEPYTCKECGLEYCTSAELKTHMLSHSAEEHQNTFSSAFEPETHFKEHSNVVGLSSYTCKFCTRTFKKKYNWQIHMKTHTGERDYFCHFCARTFWRKYNWKIHMKTHTGDRAYSCNHCPKSFITSSRLKFHVKSKHSYVSLDVSGTASGNLRKRIQDSDESVSDDEVNSRKLSKLSQDSHGNSTLEAGSGRLKAKHHDTDETLAMQTFTDAEQQDGGLETAALYSKIAEKMMSTSQSAFILPSGKASMESYPPSSSDSVTNGSSTVTVQEQNISDQRRNKNDSKQNCHQINVKTQNSEKTKYVESGSSTYDDSVISLDRVSSGNIPDDAQAISDIEICDTLDLKMNSSTIRKELMLDTKSGDENMVDKIIDIMHDNRPYYLCSICNTKFPTKETFKEHKNLHPKDTPFVCIECGLGFMCKTDLEEHCQVNKSDKQYECHNCGKCFGKSDNLISHFQTHSGEKHYKCEVCDRRFTTSAELTYHKRKKNPENCYHYCYKPQYEKAQIMTYPSMEGREDIAKEVKRQDNIAKDRKSQEDIAKDRKNREDKELVSGKSQTSDNIYCDSRQVLVFPKTPVMKHGYPQIALNKTLMKFDPLVLRDVAKHVLHVPIGEKQMTGGSKQKDDIQTEALTAAVSPKTLVHKVTWKMKRPYECKVCGRRFVSSYSRLKHMKSHMDQLHWCDICDKWYNLASDLERHKLHLHPTASEQESICVPLVTYLCDVCQLEWKSEESLREHMKTHDHQCPKCSRAFSNDRLYQIHCGICTGAEVDNMGEEPNASVTCDGFEITCSPPGSDIEDEEQNIEN